SVAETREPGSRARPDASLRVRAHAEDRVLREAVGTVVLRQLPVAEETDAPLVRRDPDAAVLAGNERADEGVGESPGGPRRLEPLSVPAPQPRSARPGPQAAVPVGQESVDRIGAQPVARAPPSLRSARIDSEKPAARRRDPERAAGILRDRHDAGPERFHD